MLAFNKDVLYCRKNQQRQKAKHFHGARHGQTSPHALRPLFEYVLAAVSSSIILLFSATICDARMDGGFLTFPWMTSWHSSVELLARRLAGSNPARPRQLLRLVLIPPQPGCRWLWHCQESWSLLRLSPLLVHQLQHHSGDSISS